MAKKGQKIHGVKPTPTPTVIRWLGAFAFQRDLKALCEFESSPGRPVSGEPLTVDGKSRLLRIRKNVSVGLVVDTTSTTLIKAFVADAATPCVNHDGWRDRRDTPFVKEWCEINGSSRSVYGECLMASPKYSHILCVGKEGLPFAEALRAEFEIPIIFKKRKEICNNAPK